LERKGWLRGSVERRLGNGQEAVIKLADAAKHGSSEAGRIKLAELVGSLLGSFTGSAAKSISGG